MLRPVGCMLGEGNEPPYPSLCDGSLPRTLHFVPLGGPTGWTLHFVPLEDRRVLHLGEMADYSLVFSMWLASKKKVQPSISGAVIPSWVRIVAIWERCSVP